MRERSAYMGAEIYLHFAKPQINFKHMKNIAIQGIAYDKKSSFLRGPALAPPLVRQSLHSNAYNSYAENGRSMEQDTIRDLGDFEIEDYFDIEQLSKEHLSAHQRLFTIGGDHSITYPILRAYKQFFPSFTVLQIDAHPDLYDEFEGDRYAHACPFARIMEEKLANRLVQMGIRTLNPHQREQAQRYGVEIIEMRHFDPAQLPHFDQPLYLSLDLDALDPAFAPGVSHQEPGGFSSRSLLQIIQNIKVPIIGADIVEYNPLRDQNGITAALAGKLTKELLSMMLQNGW